MVVDVVVDTETVPDPDCETVPELQGEALWEPDAVPHALTVVDGESDVEPVALTDPLFEPDTDAVADVENVIDTVDDGELVPDVDRDTERVLQGDAVYETDTVPHALDDGDDDGDVETDALKDALTEPVTVVVWDVVTVEELENVDEIVDDGERVPDDDCDTERVLQDDAV